jgi:hypothetical protein
MQGDPTPAAGSTAGAAPTEVAAGTAPPSANAETPTQPAFVAAPDGGTALDDADALAERRARHEAMREERERKRAQWLELRRTRREQKEARILESVADDPEARALWEARFEERRRKREAAEWRRSEEGREARRQRAREHAERARDNGPPPELPSEEGAVIGGPRQGTGAR